MAGGPIRVLGAAYAAVPGVSPHTSAMRAMLDGLDAELDFVTLKTEHLPHVQRMDHARMFRVPVATVLLEQRRDRYARAVKRQLEAEHYDVIHVFDPWAGDVAATHLADSDANLEIVYEPLQVEDRPGWLEAHRRTLKMAARVVAPTQAIASALEKEGARATEVVPPAVDVGLFDYRDAPPNPAPRLLFVGELTPQRDFDALLGALVRIADHRPIRALLIGERDRDRRRKAREQIATAGISALVEVRDEPKARRLPSLIASCDIGVAAGASRAIGGCAELPQPLLEYLACFRPLVAANVGGVGELVRDEGDGLLYPPGDAGALADAVLEMLRDAVLRERLVETGYRHVRDRLSSGARRRRIRQVYDGLLPGSQNADGWAPTRGESVTGSVEINALGLPGLEAEETRPGDSPRPDTDETKAPGEPISPAGISADTRPGLVLPDTDPGH